MAITEEGGRAFPERTIGERTILGVSGNVTPRKPMLHSEFSLLLWENRHIHHGLWACETDSLAICESATPAGRSGGGTVKGKGYALSFAIAGHDHKSLRIFEFSRESRQNHYEISPFWSSSN